MTTFKRSKKLGWAPVALTALQESDLRLQQVANDLKAAKVREEMHRADELKLVEEINRLRRDKQLTDGIIDSLTRDRNDWRDAFKLIMKLVK